MSRITRYSLPALLVSGFVALSTLSSPAQAAVDFSINLGPPAPRYEVVPEPRAGYIWAPGYWGWEGRRHVWHRGHWMHSRAGYHWAPDRWDHEGDRYHYYRGHWDRD